jgi:CubicO group peptidase (beta-lactamase class C family)
LGISRRSLLAGSALWIGSLAAFGDKESDLPSGLAHQIRSLMAENDVPGLGFGYVRGGRIACVAAFGLADRAARRPVTPDTVFNLASVSKVVTGTVLMQLCEVGLFDLDAPIQSHLDFTVVNPRHSGSISFRQLFTHTSSISDQNYQGFIRPGDPTIPLRDFLAGYLSPKGRWYTPDGSFADQAPGARFLYSNVGIALAGYLAERISNRSLKTLADEKVFRPLDMAPAAWTLAALGHVPMATPYKEADGKLIPIAPIGYPDWPAGLIRTSTRAVTNFIAAYANSGQFRGKRILRSRTLKTMITPIAPPPLPQGHIRAQGLFWEEFQVSRPGIFGKSGTDNGAVVLTNRGASTTFNQALLKLIETALA